MITVRVKKLDPAAKLPTRASAGAACFDVYALDGGPVDEKAVLVVHTGLVFEVPRGYEMQIRPRSGLAKKEGLIIVNSPGTLDSDYRGELMILLRTFPRVGYYIVNPGDRIAQIKISEVPPVQFVETEELSVTERGDGGYGSTGR
jgi:dUTP pyrophosphatase